MDEFVTLLERPTTDNAVAAISKGLRGVGRINGLSLDKEMAANIARERAGDLVKELDGWRDVNLKRLIARALREDMDKRELQLRVADVVGLTERQAIAVESMREGLVAGGMGRGEARARAREQAQRYRNERARVIARTEIHWALNEARRRKWAEEYSTFGHGKRRVWRTHPDERTCKVCMPLNGVRIPIIEGMYSTAIGLLKGPPAHPNCRCWEVVK